MATKKLMLNTNRQLKDGTYPLVMQIIHNRQKKVLYSGLYLYAKEYDSKSECVIPYKQRYRPKKEINKINRIITDFTNAIQNTIEQLEKSSHSYTVQEIVDRYDITHSGDSLSEYWEQYIETLKHEGRIGMANAQRYTLSSVLAFHKSANLRVSHISRSFVQDYQRYLLDRQVSMNTVSYYMRNFKSIIRKAAGDMEIDKNAELFFEGVKTRPQKTLKRAMTREKLRQMAQLDVNHDASMSLARDLFMFSFYARGMAFVDIAFLKKENIVGDTIRYARRKTKQYLQIGVNEPIRAIMNRYENVSQYIFPVIFSNDQEQAYIEYRSALRKINKSLKVLGKLLDIQIPLTTYVARHSWATQAREQGFPMSVISEGLGHTSENITQIYLKEFEQNVLDNANEVITNL